MTVRTVTINAKKAAENLAELLKNPYPGRIIVTGHDKTGTYLLQFYAIMGRSESSRNRIFVADNATGILKTDLADPGKEKGDPSLIIYTAMAEGVSDKNVRIYAVSNGAQTEDAIRYPLVNSDFEKLWSYESDAPNFTPRITATCSLDTETKSVDIGLSILLKNKKGVGYTNRYFEKLETQLFEEAGYGICLHTYEGNGNPLPSFRKDPYYIPLPEGKLTDALDVFWNMLDPENRVSAAVKRINIASGESLIAIINKYEKVV